MGRSWWERRTDLSPRSSPAPDPPPAASRTRTPLCWLNAALLPLKLVLPQPVVRRLPGLTTNEDVRIARVLAEVRGRLLDVGCKSNRLARDYRRAGGQAVGVDVYPWPGADLIVDDSAALPLPTASFDTVSFVASLNHIPRREATLREAHRLLRPGGRLVLTYLRPVASRLWHLYAWWDEDQRTRGMKPGEVWGFDDRELAAILDRAGFVAVERRAFSWRLNRLVVCARKVDGGLQ